MESITRETWGVDFGSTNVALARILPDETWETQFINFKGDIEPYDLVDKVMNMFQDWATWQDWSSFSDESPMLFIEDVYCGPSRKTYARMIKVEFAIKYMSHSHGIRYANMNANRWQKMVCGDVRLGKEEVQRRAAERWPLLDQYKYDKKSRGHRSDALCIAEAGRLLLMQGEYGQLE